MVRVKMLSGPEAGTEFEISRSNTIFDGPRKGQRINPLELLDGYVSEGIAWEIGFDWATTKRERIAWSGSDAIARAVRAQKKKLRVEIANVVCATLDEFKEVLNAKEGEVAVLWDDPEAGLCIVHAKDW